MTDRRVRQVLPEPMGEAQLFSAYTDRPNVVLLGDPGAGKTHLFETFARAEDGIRITARSFLNLPVTLLPRDKAIYIDALDEKRSGRGDQSSIDAMVRKLAELRPKSVRLACRVRDWLGETDLAAFNDYFANAGGCVVVALEPLTQNERLAVLSERGLAAPAAFLREAEQRGLDELLRNPQNLIMLSDVVSNGVWPQSRKELFERSVQILLSEHNATHTEARNEGMYSADELRDAAGGLCAVRLLSDIDGICVGNADRHEAPSFRSISVDNIERVGAALTRRAFTSGTSGETVDYAHRTIAEFLAASWLAKKIRQGLPLERVLALVTVSGRPATELRGLHAWLPVFLPAHAIPLIEADPFGVLSYGDAASMSPPLRKVLLKALGDLAESDPWFRAGNWSSAAVATLSGNDMVPAFRRLLNDPHSLPAFRSTVLDAIAAGPPLRALESTLFGLLVDQARPYGERHSALEALSKMGETTKARLARSYRQIGGNVDEIMLRSELLGRAYGHGLGPLDVAELLRVTFDAQEDVTTGAFYDLDQIVPREDIEAVLNAITIPGASDSRDRWRNATEVLRVFDGLLISALSDRATVSGAALWGWLSERQKIAESRSYTENDALRSALTSRLATLHDLFWHAFGARLASDDLWAFLRRFDEVAVGAMSTLDVLGALTEHLSAPANVSLFAYELALSCALRSGADGLAAFEALYALAEMNPALRAARDEWCTSVIPDWRKQQQQRNGAAQAKRAASQSMNRDHFFEELQSIRTGEHFGWLRWLGKAYFGRFSDLNNDLDPIERIAAELGPDTGEVVRDGLLALVARQQITPLEEVISMNRAGKWFEWWLAIMAGLDERHRAGTPTDDLSDTFVASVIAITCYNPTNWHEGGSGQRVEHPWKQELRAKRPNVVLGVYVRLIREALEGGATGIVHGFHEVFDGGHFATDRMAVAQELLQSFPVVNSRLLGPLLGTLLSSVNSTDLLALVTTSLGKTNGNNEALTFWLAAGFLLDPDRFKQQIQDLNADAKPAFVWAVRELAGYRRRTGSEHRPLSVEQLEFLIRFAGELFPRAGHPKNGWSGDTNPWDGTEFVNALVNQLSADPSRSAGSALDRLCGCTKLSSYRDDLLHARASQVVRLVDAEYSQPKWQEALATLANGKPAGAADLHALLLSHVPELQSAVRSANTDIYKQFWNEDNRGRLTTPKVEERCRDVLVELLRPRLEPQNVRAEPEGHMADDKRADIVALADPALKVVVELKRDTHAEVWTAAQTQLQRFYVRDPECKGFGLYGVFWFGDKRRGRIPRPPNGAERPRSANEMKSLLTALIPADQASKIAVIVIDVSGPESKKVGSRRRSAARRNLTRRSRN